MKSTALPIAIYLGFTLISSPGIRAAGSNAHLARPSANQYAWHEQERIMFVHFGVATWEGTEYDKDGKTDLSKMNPAGFNAEEICATAQSWGARQILLVCKHVGGFCWWPTETTDYCVRSIPWQGGKGNLVKEVADACRRHGLAMGIYVYSDDPRYTSGIGNGGKTDDPAKQEEWNRLLRKQWEEVLTLCGPDLVREIWFDGSCIVPLTDIIQRLAPDAVVLQSPITNIRWVGNEAGIARDPNWNTLMGSALKSGVATQDHSDPAGDTWAPVECDVPLYNHNWFWNPGNERKRLSVAQLLDIYVKSAGRGSVLLLNSTPNTDGRIPDGDRACYLEFGQALERNFGHPLAVATKVAGRDIELDLGDSVKINCADLWEDYRLGHRIRGYVIEGRVNGAWIKLAQGTAVGRRKLDLFAPVTADRVRVRVTDAAGEPVIRRFQVHRVDAALAEGNAPPLSQNAPAKASTVHSAPYEARFLVDGDPQTRWSVIGPEDTDPWVEIDLGRPRKFARASANELDDRIRKFRIEFRDAEGEPWRIAYQGQGIGGSWSADFDRVTGRFVRLHILEYVGPGPTLWEFQLRDRPEAWETIGGWQGGKEMAVDLSRVVCEAGQYEVRFLAADGKPLTVGRAVLLFEGREAESVFLSGVRTEVLKLNRTQAIGEGASTALRVTLDGSSSAKGVVQIRP
ncbi:MAG: alpha-L-fucosidase [Akkermansiaceae bacterium]|nr:alpha-L-fucosidase [Akkermansiaceae bacterium]